MQQPVFVSQEETELQFDYMSKVAAIVGERYSGRGKPCACVVTFGCQQNEEDSEKLCGMLSQMGYEIIDDRNNADIVILNTCAVREHPEQKIYGIIGALKGVKAQRPDMLLGLCGCMAQQEHIETEIREKYPYVDLYFGPLTLHRFPEMLFCSLNGHKRVCLIDRGDGRIAEGLPQKRKHSFSAYVTISSGCNNFCSYCVVPYVRGRERSRRGADILNDVRTLVSNGAREIVLLGQNVNSYGHDLENGQNFASLLRDVACVDGDFRVRFMTSHPKDLTTEVLDAMAGSDKICSHLHLPVQSGSDDVLDRMNRRYTRSRYIEIIDYARQVMPDITFTTDIIVGFPGETESDFEQTVSLLEQVRYETVFSFIFSRRRGTPAFDMPGQIEYADKLRRFNRLIKVQEDISTARTGLMQGRELRVLAVGRSEKNPSYIEGRTDSNKIVFFAGPDDLIGSFCRVRVTQAKTWFSYGERITE